VRPTVWPKKVLSLFAPSTTSELSVPRWPAKLMSPPRTSRTTPGVVRTKSMKLRPLTGRFWMAFSLTTELTSDLVVSITGEAATGRAAVVGDVAGDGSGAALRECRERRQRHEGQRECEADMLHVDSFLNRLDPSRIP